MRNGVLAGLVRFYLVSIHVTVLLSAGAFSEGTLHAHRWINGALRPAHFSKGTDLSADWERGGTASLVVVTSGLSSLDIDWLPACVKRWMKKIPTAGKTEYTQRNVP